MLVIFRFRQQRSVLSRRIIYLTDNHHVHKQYPSRRFCFRYPNKRAIVVIITLYECELWRERTARLQLGGVLSRKRMAKTTSGLRSCPPACTERSTCKMIIGRHSFAIVACTALIGGFGYFCANYMPLYRRYHVQRDIFTNETVSGGRKSTDDDW